MPSKRILASTVAFEVILGAPWAGIMPRYTGMLGKLDSLDSLQLTAENVREPAQFVDFMASMNLSPEESGNFIWYLRC